jgi:hypothetical protein
MRPTRELRSKKYLPACFHAVEDSIRRRHSDYGKPYNDQQLSRDPEAGGGLSVDAVSGGTQVRAREVMLGPCGCGRKGEEMNERRQDPLNRQHAGWSSGAGSAGSEMGGGTNPAPRIAPFTGLALGAVGLLLIGVVGFLIVGHLKNQARQIVQDTLPGISYAGEVNANLAQTFSRTLLLLLVDTPGQHAQAQQDIESFTQATALCLDGYQNQIYTREDQALFDKLLQLRAEYLAVRGQTIALIESNQPQEARALAKAKLVPAYGRYQEGGDKLFEYNVRQGNSRGHTIMSVCTLAQIVVAALVVIVFALGFWTGLFK